MMRNITKCIVMTMMLVMAFTSVAFAAVDVNAVSQEEYADTLKVEYAKYGIDFEVLDYGDVIITRDMLNSELEKVKEFANNIEVTNLSFGVVAQPSITQPVVVPEVSTANKTIYGTWIINNPYGTANMKSEVNVTYNIGNMDIISAKSYKTYQSGAFVNFDSWTTTSMTGKISNTKITLDIKGRATFSYADPYTGIKTGYTSNITKSITLSV